MLLLGEFKDEVKDAVTMFNAILFVMNHSSTFKWRTRICRKDGVRYKGRFVVTEKRKMPLDDWASKGRDGEEDIDEDITTEENPSDGYYSDDY